MAAADRDEGGQVPVPSAILGGAGVGRLFFIICLAVRCVVELPLLRKVSLLGIHPVQPLDPENFQGSIQTDTTG